MGAGRGVEGGEPRRAGPLRPLRGRRRETRARGPFRPVADSRIPAPPPPRRPPPVSSTCTSGPATGASLSENRSSGRCGKPSPRHGACCDPGGKEGRRRRRRRSRRPSPGNPPTNRRASRRVIGKESGPRAGVLRATIVGKTTSRSRSGHRGRRPWSEEERRPIGPQPPCAQHHGLTASYRVVGCGGTAPSGSLALLDVATAMLSKRRLPAGAVASATRPAPLSDHPSSP